jgi:uncharacterized protein YdaU (DUF1376 family)
MSDLPYMPLWVSKYEAHTAHLTLCEDGAYLRLLRLCWRTPGGTIPADDAWVQRQMRVDAETFAAYVKPILTEFFTIRRGRYVNDALKRFFDEATEKSQRRKNAGRKGGEAKARKSNDSRPSNATALAEQCSSKTETETHTEPSDANASEVIAAVKRKRPKPVVEPHFMADDWWPSEADFAWAADPKNTKGIQLTREEAENETHQCKRWFLDKRDAGNPVGKRPGHTRSWQSWICKSAPEVIRARPRANGTPIRAGARVQTRLAPQISQHDAFAVAAAQASGSQRGGGWEPDHGNGARPPSGPPRLEVIDSGDARGADAAYAGGNRGFDSQIVLPLPFAAVR